MENEVTVGLSQTLRGANGYLMQADCIGIPSTFCTEASKYGVGCVLFQRDPTTNYQTIVWENTGTVASPTWTKRSNTGTITKKVSLTSAQILALNGTPIELIPAPGVGKVIDVIDVIGYMNFLTAAYATNTELDIIDSAGGILFKDTGTLLAATASKGVKIATNIASNAGVVLTANGNIQAKVASGNPATGAGTLDLFITYKVITL